MPKVPIVDYLKTLASMWQAHAPSGGISLDSYARQLALYAKELNCGPGAPDVGLDLFRQLVMARENDLRWRMLGANVQRKSELSSVQRSALLSLEVEPDLLGPMRELRYEPIHTKLLAYHLDPVNGSELAPQLLEAFLISMSRYCQERGYAEPTYAPGCEVSVEPERTTSKGRVDISISLSNMLILVENKIDATEGHAQLDRYHDALTELRGARQGLLVYLTLPGAQPPRSRVPCVHMTFRDVLHAWLPFSNQADGSSNYLARYLKSIAVGLLELCRQGGFDRWSLREQRAMLELVEECVA
ncbi:PD-(D/E)XK nuclease family protein [Pelomonas baiyunensis]|uniref:PD-(D/E)XK nuclease family protein n=1 Tax=Pelomonas baiyunensis TaxID=3299026 RepID=A0ABW7H2J0_9BURK